MIRMMALCDSRYELHFVLTNFASSYVGKLKQLADNIVPGRVFFHSPLPSMQIVNGISKYDVGFYSLTPTNYNNLIALPNKLFEFIAAGLAVCIGPSPSMAEIVNQYGCGIVSPSFKPEDLAAILNNTSSSDWDKMKRSSIIATKELNGDKEMRILLEIYESLFSEKII
jgi:glycosyltransferase involved in cell wall biosynthesis